MKRDFHWQRRAAVAGSLAINLFVLLAYWLFQTLHVRGWFQGMLAQVNALAWMLSFPAYLVVQRTGIRDALSPPHRISTSTWWIMWAINLVMWAVALRLVLGLFGARRSRAEAPPAVTAAPGQRDSAAPAPPLAPDAPGTLTTEDLAREDPAREDPAREDPAREDLAREDPAAPLGHAARSRATPRRSAARSAQRSRGIALHSAAPVAQCNRGIAPRSAGPATAPTSRPTRRRFLTIAARGAVACAAATGAYSMLLETRWYQVTRRRHAIRGLRPELAGLRLVQLTDIHYGPALSLGYVRDVVAAANALEPDLVLLTGDYVHRSPVYIEPVLRELAELRGRVGVVGVLGNHDWWESEPLSREAFARAGIPLIDNDRLFVSPDRRMLSGPIDQGLCVAGVGDYIEDRIRPDRALRDVPQSMPRLMLSHNPDVAEHPPLVADRTRIDLMLCGHTHGGQIRIPLIGTPVIPSRFGSKYASGLVQGPICPVYISRGIGTTILPLRFGCPPEITVIELQCG